MRIFYDTEFIEDGTTIDLVSIGMVAEDGRELYAVSNEFDERTLLENQWLRENVWPSLPIVEHAHSGTCRCAGLHRKHGQLDLSHPDVRPRAQIARLVQSFIEATPDPQLWAWYGAYDHVALCQLWGRMIDLPEAVPMWTNDLKQEAVRLGDPKMPEQESGQHNALADARHNWTMALHLDQLSATE